MCICRLTLPIAQRRCADGLEADLKLRMLDARFSPASGRVDGTFSRSDFRYDPTSDVYHCPGGKRLGTSGTVHEGKTLLYRASKLDCDACPLKPQCCPKEPSRKIPRDIHEHA